MNQVSIVGRMTKDPEVRYSQSNTAFGRFTVAIDRGKDKDGNDRGADFPSVVCFGKTAELVEKYCFKGMLVGVAGRLQTGSYEKDGHKVYTTDILAERVEFLSRRENNEQQNGQQTEIQPTVPEGFAQMSDDDFPF